MNESKDITDDYIKESVDDNIQRSPLEESTGIIVKSENYKRDKIGANDQKNKK